MLGLYGMAGKLSAVVGPLLFGAIVLVMDPERNGPIAYQVAILSLLVLMIVGFWIVRSVPEGSPPDEALLPLAEPVEPAIVQPGETPP
jgi:MFS-type transporter involved in bile tolerance (Atg22 family)